MANQGPGTSYRRGLSLVDALNQFSNDEDAERWFTSNRWPNGVACPFCGSLDDVAERKNRKPQPYNRNWRSSSFLARYMNIPALLAVH